METTKQKKIKIFIISPFFWTMGDGRGIPIIYQTINGLIKNGFEIHLFVPTKVPKIRDFHKEINVYYFKTVLTNFPNIKYISLIFQKIYWLMFIFSATIRMMKIANTNKPHVVYGISLFGAPVAFLIAKLYNIPNITRLFGTFLYPYLKNPVKLFSCFDEILAFRIPTSLLIVTNDGTCGDIVAKKFNVPMDRLKFWMNGIDKSRKNMELSEDEILSLKMQFNIPQGKKIVLTISRLVNWKRVDRLIISIPEILLNRDDVVFLIIGDGNERSKLQNLVRTLDIDRSVIFTGSVMRENIFKLLKISDIFVSLYDLSNLGNPLLEAMICGKCIITLKTGDTEKVIHNMENGIILGIDDLPKLPKIINNLLSDECFRNKLGNQAQQFACQNFEDWSERINKECRTIKTLLITDSR